MQLEVNIVNAFTDQGLGGNPAGVVLEADKFNDRQKQEIAARAGLSEIAFVSRSHTDTVRLDFFTPTRRIAHCGHATIATFSFLAEKGLVGAGEHSKETIDGSRRVVVRDGQAFMEQLAPRYQQVEQEHQAVLQSLGLKNEDILNGPMLVNTGNNFIVLGVQNGQTLAAIQPQQDLIREVSERLDLIGYYIYALDTDVAGRDATTRMFAPRYGIAEEAATGMAAGPLACYLHDHCDIRKSHYQIEQGRHMPAPSPSLIHVHLTLDADRIQQLMAGGSAQVMDQMQIEPADTDGCTA